MRLLKLSLAFTGSLLVLMIAPVATAGDDWVSGVKTKYDQAKALFKLGDTSAAQPVYAEVVAMVDGRALGKWQDLREANKLKQKALLHLLDITLSRSDSAEAGALLIVLKRDYPDQNIESVQEAAVTLGQMTPAQAAELSDSQTRQARAFEKISTPWEYKRGKHGTQVCEATLLALRPLMTEGGATSLRARRLAARVLLELGRNDEAVPLLMDLWRQTAPESFFHQDVEAKLLQVVAFSEELTMQVLPSAINNKDQETQVVARLEWMMRLRKMGRHSEVVDLAQRTAGYWDEYVQSVGRDASVDRDEAVLFLEGGVALSTLTRQQEAVTWLEKGRAAAARLPAADGMKQPLEENFQIELAKAKAQ